MQTTQQPTTDAVTPGPVLLGAHASRRCPVRVHNDHDRTVPKAPWVPPEELQLRFDSGTEFEQRVLDRLVAQHGADCVDLRSVTDRRERTEGTLTAMRSAALLVVGGRLPADIAGGRTGRPDVLLRVDTAQDGQGRYVPVEVKWHLGAQRRAKGVASLSTLATPTDRVEVAGMAARTSQRFDDLLQLAHYTRMLQACGFHPGAARLVGAVLGTDQIDCGTGRPDLVLVWHQLSDQLFSTFSRSRGHALRSVLERYDHEHEFRVKVAEVAERRTGSADDPEPLVVPVAQAECCTCPYLDRCFEQMGHQEPSVAITAGRLGVREWLTLQALGVVTTTALAEVDPDDETFMAAYLAELTHDEAGASKRLREAVQRAQMLRDGVPLLRIGTGPLVVPRADVEVDLDYESDTDGRKYLWGARVSRQDGAGGHQEGRYRAFVRWDEIDAEAERELAAETLAWLRAVVAETEARGETVQVHHWTGVEPSALRQILGAEQVADVLEHFVDLYEVVKTQFIGLRGLGLKSVAPSLGFGWRDDDAGGAQSMVWLQVARDASSPQSQAMRHRILEYNEDDVEATAHVRRRLSERAADERGEVSPR